MYHMQLYEQYNYRVWTVWFYAADCLVSLYQPHSKHELDIMQGLYEGDCITKQ
jgi:hypothetical protein